MSQISHIPLIFPFHPFFIHPHIPQNPLRPCITPISTYFLLSLSIYPLRFLFQISPFGLLWAPYQQSGKRFIHNPGKQSHNNFNHFFILLLSLNKPIPPLLFFKRAKPLHWPSKIHLRHLKFSPSESLKIFTVSPIYTLFPSPHSLLPFSYNVRTPLAGLLFSHTVSTIFLSNTPSLFLPRPFHSLHCSPPIFYNVQFPLFSKSIHFSSLTINEKNRGPGFLPFLCLILFIMILAVTLVTAKRSHSF